MARTDQQIAAEAEKNRRQMLATEAAALLLLLRRRNAAIASGDPERVRAAIRNAVLEIRASASVNAIARLRNELLTLGINVDPTRVSIADISREIARAERIGGNFSRDWQKSRLLTGAAAGAAMVVLNRRLRAIAATEVAHAHNRAREQFVRVSGARRDLYRVWDATLDKRTCPVCEQAHGEIVRLGDSFSAGEPGGVHTNCRCSETILRGDEISDFSMSLLAA